MPFSTRLTLACGIGGLALFLTSRAAAEQLTWHRSPWFEEVSVTAPLEPAGRFHVNAPLDKKGAPAPATRIILYALPNGNTIEQTLGCRMAQGLDWHYDIQHVAGQVRLLRALWPDERIVLICAEAGGLSWPAWRRAYPDANARIVRFVEQWRARFGTPDCNVLLAGHSGGGSFLFGLLEGDGEIPAYIDRIAFLDANYSFDDATHTDKLRRWLGDDDSRRLIVLAYELIVLAYDDREIMLDGKKVVGPTGGTFRATERMRQAFARHFALTDTVKSPFHETTALDGRIHFFVHPNPENKILHTALVGEMNGLAHVATLGTARAGKWGRFGGPRAYNQWVQPEPEEKTAAKTLSNTEDQPPEKSESAAGLPARPTDAVGGTAFMKSLDGLDLDRREAAIEREILRGNFPSFLRRFKQVPLARPIADVTGERPVRALMEVMPDYLAVGSDADFVRIPMTPQTAQQIADAFDCVLPTRKIVDAIDARAELRLAPRPLTREREATSTFLQHHQIIERQRGDHSPDLLVSGIKKDIVLTPRIFERPQRLAIYGWRQLDGQPIQPLTIVHWSRYVDYSHGVRLVRNTIEIEGQPARITDLLADPQRCGLVSDEGPMDPPRYPLD
jgi:hypothetical protein